MKKYEINLNFDLDFHFWAIVPALNLNFHSKTFEFEWLCFALYIDVILIKKNLNNE